MSRNSNKKHKSPAKKRISAKRGKKAMKMKNIARRDTELLGLNIAVALSKKNKIF